MEKRNYLKPTIEFYGINSTTSFMAASNLVIEEGSTGTTAVTMLDKCVMFSGTHLNDNSAVIEDLKKSNYSKCYTIRRYETLDPNKEDICPDPRFVNDKKVRVTYYPETGTFVFEFDNNCSSSTPGRH